MQSKPFTKQRMKIIPMARGRVLEIGIGSGCILLSILKERKNFYGTGIDISKKSLDTCRINGENLGVINRLKLFKSDIDNFHFRKYDLIISLSLIHI